MPFVCFNLSLVKVFPHLFLALPLLLSLPLPSFPLVQQRGGGEARGSQCFHSNGMKRKKTTKKKKDKQNEIELVSQKIRNEMSVMSASKDAAIRDLEATLNARDIAQQLAIAEAVTAAEKQRDLLANELQQVRDNNLTASRLAESKYAKDIQSVTLQKDAELRDLKAKLDAVDVKQKLAISEALNRVEKDRDQLRNSLDQTELKHQLAEQSLKERYEIQIKDRDQAIERLRDMKARLSTKMVGETLEQHCEIEFNRIRAAAFPVLTLKRIMMLERAVKVTIFFVIRMKVSMKSFQLCLK